MKYITVVTGWRTYSRCGMMYATCAVGYNCGDCGTRLMSKVGKTVLWLLAALAAVWIATHWEEFLSQLRSIGMMPFLEERLHSSGVTPGSPLANLPAETALLAVMPPAHRESRKPC